MQEVVWRKVLKLVIAGVLFIIMSSGLFAQSRAIPDPAFGTAGMVLEPVAAGNNETAQSVIVQQDGKILIAGKRTNTAGKTTAVLIRYRKNGRPDKTFNGSGKLLREGTVVNAMLVQADDKIIACGSSQAGGPMVLEAMRLNADGTPDLTFGNSGLQSLQSVESGVFHSIALQTDGKILLGATAYVAGFTKTVVVLQRLDGKGNPDSTFAGKGYVLIAHNDKAIDCSKVLLQPDGKIIVGGQLDSMVNGRIAKQFFVARLTNDGKMDSTFGLQGIATAHISNSDACYSAGLLPDGRIVLSGTLSFTGYEAAGIVCFLPDGRIDDAFGNHGWSYPDFFGSNCVNIHSIQVLASGSILLAGIADFTFSNSSTLALALLNSEGNLDASFGRKGIDTFFTAPLKTIGCQAVALTRDGNIVAAGFMLNEQQQLMTVRLLTDKAMDAPALKTENDFTLRPVQAAQQERVRPQESEIGAGNSGNPVKAASKK